MGGPEVSNSWPGPAHILIEGRKAQGQPASTCFYHVYVYITKFWISIVPNSTENFEHEKAFFCGETGLDSQRQASWHPF